MSGEETYNTNPNAYLIILVQGYISFRLDKLIHTE